MTADHRETGPTDRRLRRWLDRQVVKYNHPGFIEGDPISVPHRFSRQQDIEIAGFFTAIMAWGRRTTIIQKANELMRLMDDAPYDFIVHHEASDLKPMLGFCHRTLQPDDVLFLVDSLRAYFQSYESLETAFRQGISPGDTTVEGGLNTFCRMLFDRPIVMERTRKHIPAPERGSSCKRINMYLRWMVRRDDRGVDFGLWQAIKPSQLVIPLDVHVGRVARELGLLQRAQDDWRAALELTDSLRAFDRQDPVKYDFALFGAGVSGEASEGIL